MSFADFSLVQIFSKICTLYQSSNEDAQKHKHEPNMVLSKAYVIALRKKL